MIVYSNKSEKREDYVEVVLSRDAIHVKGVGNETGWGVSSLVFSHNPRYDELVEFKKLHRAHQREEALALLLTVARQYGLTEDPGGAHRRRIWSV